MPDEFEIEDIRGDLDSETLITRLRRDWQAAQNHLTSNIHAVWMDAIKLFKGQHLETPKAGRSKLFLRKPRNVSERIKAGLLEAFFSTPDYVNVEPARQDVPDDALGARIRKAYVNYRLSGKPIPWFQICYSAFEDLAVFNLCVARVEWVVEQELLKGERQTPILNPESGSPIVGEDGQPLTQTETIEHLLTITDEPRITLLLPERMKIDPRADWTNPYAGQFMIEQDFMTYQALLNLADIDPLIDRDGLDLVSRTAYDDAVTQARYSGATPQVFTDPDRLEIEVRRYWYKIGSIWWVAWTAADRAVIRKPQKNPYAHGKPSYVFGFHVPESHLFHSDSILNIHKDYFTSMNGIRNQRFDNVALALNKHAIVSREAQADLDSLVNRRAGGVTLVDGDVQKAVHWDEIPDISTSGYNEEILLDRELQEGTGATDLGNAVSAPKNELATQSLLRQQGANKKEAVNIRIVAATFIVPCIEMLISIADQFETDRTVLSIVGASIGLGESDDNIPNLLDIKGQYSVKVNAGIGSPTPDVKREQFIFLIRELNTNFGPLATLPLWPQVLPLFGVSNVKEVLEAIRVAQQLEQLMMMLQQAQEKQMARETGKPSGGGGAGKMPTEQGNMRRQLASSNDRREAM